MMIRIFPSIQIDIIVIPTRIAKAKQFLLSRQGWAAKVRSIITNKKPIADTSKDVCASPKPIYAERLFTRNILHSICFLSLHRTVRSPSAVSENTINDHRVRQIPFSHPRLRLSHSRPRVSQN
jgi:hypothetical protein